MRKLNLSALAVRHSARHCFSCSRSPLAAARISSSAAPRSLFTIKVAVVTAMWPGATASELQEQVADRIEKKIQELPYFYKVQTYSKAGFVAMQVEFRDTTPPAQVPISSIFCAQEAQRSPPELPAGLMDPMSTTNMAMSTRSCTP